MRERFTEKKCLEPLTENRVREWWLNVHWQGAPENGCCSRKRAPTNSRPTERRNMRSNCDEDERSRRRPGRSATSANQMTQIWWSEATQQAEHRDSDLEIDPFWQTQPMQCCKHVGDVVVIRNDAIDTGTPDELRRLEQTQNASAGKPEARPTK